MYVVCMYPCGPNDRYGNEYKTKAKKKLSLPKKHYRINHEVFMKVSVIFYHRNLIANLIQRWTLILKMFLILSVLLFLA